MNYFGELMGCKTFEGSWGGVQKLLKVILPQISIILHNFNGEGWGHENVSYNRVWFAKMFCDFDGGA